jgi:hypothetical protein
MKDLGRALSKNELKLLELFKQNVVVVVPCKGAQTWQALARRSFVACLGLVPRVNNHGQDYFKFKLGRRGKVAFRENEWLPATK